MNKMVERSYEKEISFWDNQIQNSIYSEKSPTFRKGRIGNYKNVLTKDMLDEFYERYGSILKQYRYD